MRLKTCLEDILIPKADLSYPMNTSVKFYLLVTAWLLFIFNFPTIFHALDFCPVRYNLDKIVHFVEYGILCGLLTRAFYNSGSDRLLIRSLLLSLGISLFIAGVDEMYQLYIPGRSASFYDFAADVIGIVCALVVFRFLNHSLASSRELD